VSPWPTDESGALRYRLRDAVEDQPIVNSDPAAKDQDCFVTIMGVVFNYQSARPTARHRFVRPSSMPISPRPCQRTYCGPVVSILSASIRQKHGPRRQLLATADRKAPGPKVLSLARELANALLSVGVPLLESGSTILQRQHRGSFPIGLADDGAKRILPPVGNNSPKPWVSNPTFIRRTMRPTERRSAKTPGHSTRGRCDGLAEFMERSAAVQGQSDHRAHLSRDRP